MIDIEKTVERDRERDELLIALDTLFKQLRQAGEDAKSSDLNELIAKRDVYSNDELHHVLRRFDGRKLSDEILKEFRPDALSGFNKRGRPQKALLNIACLNEWLNDQGITVRRNVISKSVETSGLDTSVYSDELLELQIPVIIHDAIKSEYSCTVNTVRDLLGVIAGSHEYNPVLELLEIAEPWDGEDRLPELYRILHIDGSDTLSQTLIKKWLLQCVALQYNSAKAPFGADGALVLQGPQGIGKTSFARKIAMRSHFFKEGISFSRLDKDSLIQATNSWIAELGELGGTMNRADRDSLKAHITQAVDEYRAPYGTSAARYVRRTSYVGTVNDDKFLVDPTGSRRWWVVPIPDIDLDALEKFNVIQLWQQIKFYVMENLQSFRLTRDEQAALLARNTEYEKPAAGVEELRDILAMAESCPQNFRWELTTVSAFMQAHEALRHTPRKIIGSALDVLDGEFHFERANYISREQAAERGINNRGRFIKLPMPKYLHSSVNAAIEEAADNKKIS